MQKRYQQDGYVSPLNALTAAEAARALADYQRIATRLGGEPRPPQLFLLHLFHRWAWDLVRHPRILDAVERILGPNVLVWDSSVFPKPARSKGFVSMHQDGTYWGLEQGEVLTAWIALTESTRANGCLRGVPGSHRLPIQRHEDTHIPENLLTRGQRIAAAGVAEAAVDIELRAGQTSLHHVRLIHGSHANDSDQPRIGYAVRYVTPDVVPERQLHPAVAALGTDTAGHWNLSPGPQEYADFEEAHAAQQEAARRQLETLT